MLGWRLRDSGRPAPVPGRPSRLAGRWVPDPVRASPPAACRAPVPERRSPLAGRRSPLRGRRSLLSGRDAGSRRPRVADPAPCPAAGPPSRPLAGFVRPEAAPPRDPGWLRDRGLEGARPPAPLAGRPPAGRPERSGCAWLSFTRRILPEPAPGAHATGHSQVRNHNLAGSGNDEAPPQGRRFVKSLGGDLLSHPASRAVPSALEGLTSGFGMGPGVSPPLWPPKRSGASGTPETSRTTQRARATRS